VVVREQRSLPYSLTVTRSVLPETIWLTVICFLDMFSTIILVSEGLARESNPLLEPILSSNPPMFLVVKMASFLIPLAIIESIRDLAPKFIQFALRAGIAAYLMIYILGSLGLVPRP